MRPQDSPNVDAARLRKFFGAGVYVQQLARANFGLLLLVALAFSRFFDSELSFVTRGLGFIVVGAGFLVANILLFKRRSAAVAA